MSSRHSTGSRPTANKRWSMPALQPLDTSVSRNSTQTQGSQEPPSPASARKSRGSISGTSYGKTDFGVPTVPAATSNDRRASRATNRVSRISKLSDVSEVESEKTRSRQMSASLESGDHKNRQSRISRRMSIAENLGEESERRRSRRVSLASVSSSVNRFSMMSRANIDWQQRAEPAEPPKTWDEDRKKASNWELQKKMLNTGLACAMAFCYTFTLSIYSFAYPFTVLSLGFSAELAVVPYAAFAFGIIFGGIVATPFEKRYGRKFVLLLSIPFFALLLIGAGVSKNAAGLIVCRFISAFFAGPGLFVIYGHVSDMWTATRLSLPLAVFTGSVLLGVSGGPIIGGVVLQYQSSWRWTIWIPLFTVVILLFSAIGMSESHKKTLIRRGRSWEEKHREEEERKQNKTKREGVTFKGNMMFLSSLKMLFTMPGLGLSNLYLGYTLAVLLVLPLLTPIRFSALHHLDYQQLGLMFVGPCVGIIVAAGFIYLVDTYIYQPRVDRWEDDHDPLNEKGEVEMTEGGDGPYVHSSWRKGLANVNTKNLGLRGSNQTDATRNNSNSSDDRASRRLSNGSRRSRLQAFSEKNINIAIAVTRHLNSNPANASKKIIVERVMVLLKNNETFTDICAALVRLGMHFEEALLAKVLVDCIEKEKNNGDIALGRSKSLHRYAAQAALMGPTNDEEADTIAPLGSPTEEPTLIRPEAPPAEWRFLPALLSILFFPTGLLLFAYTTVATVNWIIPVIGLGMTGFGAALTFFSVTSYTLELHDETTDDAIRARSGGNMLVFFLVTFFALFIFPMWKATTFQLTFAIFGFVGIALSLIPWIIFFGGDKIRGRKRTLGEL